MFGIQDFIQSQQDQEKEKQVEATSQTGGVSTEEKEQKEGFEQETDQEEGKDKEKVKEAEESLKEKDSDKDDEPKDGKSDKDDEGNDEEDEESGFLEPIVESLSDVFGELDEDAEYEDSVDGLRQLIEDSTAKKIEKYKEELSEEDLLELASDRGYVLDKSNEEFQEVDFDKIDMDDSDNHKLLLTDYYTNVLGQTPEEAEDTLEGILEVGDDFTKKQADIAREKLRKHQETRKEEYLEKQREEAIKRKEEVKQQREAIKQDLTSRKEIAGFPISKKEGEKLYSYMIERGSDGKTQFERERTDETDYLLGWLQMNKFDAKKLNRELTTKATVKIKKAMDKHSDSRSNNKGIRQPMKTEENKKTNEIPSNWMFKV